MTKDLAIGIDLGTTYSCVAVYRNNHVEIIANDQGNRTTPSCVSFSKNERYIGESALYKSGNNPKNTVTCVKRLMGRNFYDDKVQSNLKHLPFKVIEKNGRPYIQVEYKNELKDFTAEEISCMILSKMKETAENYLGQTVTDVVITVPAYFNDTQRKATIDAGKIAGLNVLQIINEPTAAALAYGLNNNIKEKENILVIDLGGGTYDVSLLSIKNGTYKVKAVAGDTDLGGEDFNNRLVNYFVNEIKDYYKTDISNNIKALNRLKIKCDRVKRILSSSVNAEIEIECLFDGIDFCSNITRSRFEEINSDLFEKIIDPIKNILRDSKLEKCDISEIVLVGGSTRIPKIEKIISSYFNDKELKKTVNPDEAVAYGAAIQASLLSDTYTYSEESEKLKLYDAIPLSLGVKIRDDDMSFFIHRNSTYPVKVKDIYRTRYDYQKSILFEIYEGERPIASKNNLLDSITLSGITPAPRGETKFEVIFEIDENGILSVSAEEKGTGLHKKITVEKNKGRLYKEEIDRMIKEAKAYHETDMKEKKRLKAMNDLEDYAYDLRKSLTYKNNYSTKNQMTLIINDTLEWIKRNKDANIEDYELKKTELQTQRNLLR